MASFKTVSWANGWEKSIEKFKHLKQTCGIESRHFFQRYNNLMIEFAFDNGDFLVIPAEVVESIAVSMMDDETMITIFEPKITVIEPPGEVEVEVAENSAS